MDIRGRWATRQVWVGGKELRPEPSLQVGHHSPDGFSWGHSGIGPEQLALALLLELTDAEVARRWYQEVTWQVIAQLPRDDFMLDARVIAHIIGGTVGETHEAEERKPVTQTTVVEVDYPYSREELQSMFDVAHGEHVTRDGRYEARSQVLTIYTQPWTDDVTPADSPRMGSLSAAWGQGNRIWQIELDEGFSLADLLEELGTLEEKALGRKIYGR